MIKYIFLLGLFQCFCIYGKAQSLFTVLHLNEETEVKHGIPKKVIKKTTFYGKTTSVIKEIIEYDQSGLPVRTVFYKDDPSSETETLYRYDTSRRILLESRITRQAARFPNEKIRTTYSYEAANSPVLIRYFDINNQLVTEVILANNNEGYPAELQLYDPPGSLVGTEIASYNYATNRVLVSVLNNRGVTVSSDSMAISFSNSHKFSRATTTYNEHNDLVHSESIWPSGALHINESEYKYDASGNWIEQKRFDTTEEKGKKKRRLKALVTREIIYW